jgi:TonB family protein
MPSQTQTPALSHPILLLAVVLGTFVASPAAAAPPATMPTATVEGGLDKPAVREVVRAHIDEVRHCYNAELVDDDTIEGRSVTSFVIHPDGSVHDASMPESTMPERFDACLLAAVGSWSFPASDAETRVTYPFQFSPG